MLSLLFYIHELTDASWLVLLRQAGEDSEHATPPRQRARPAWLSATDIAAAPLGFELEIFRWSGEHCSVAPLLSPLCMRVFCVLLTTRSRMWRFISKLDFIWFVLQQKKVWVQLQLSVCGMVRFIYLSPPQQNWPKACPYLGQVCVVVSPSNNITHESLWCLVGAVLLLVSRFWNKTRRIILRSRCWTVAHETEFEKNIEAKFDLAVVPSPKHR